MRGYRAMRYVHFSEAEYTLAALAINVYEPMAMT